MNDELYKRIKLLPQVLQDLIGEYNVEHRKQIKNLNKEYYSIIYLNCLNCNYLYNSDIFCSVDYFIYIKYKFNYYWCSVNCYNNYKGKDLKNKYEESIKDYILNITLQTNRHNLEL
jgi:hypothetical protein